ncbi:c-type cytochrome biogenesis protein CcmI [Nioella nitratireducens]|uniref:c-type cytochrome biogenesis protein CcmI n=1 Tax=Nioella nitratireducens TaxID=1287720 RepID=UPI0008FD642E|nr:c-type cytochrome biogenesis protein CcmI [Nioella nitratireducens]
MGFWMLTALLALLIGAALVLGAWRRRDDGESTAAYDLQVYQDQLREIEKDLARGVLSEDEAERTRTEISRRVLEADRALQAGEDGGHATGRGQRLAVLGLTALVLGGSFALYDYLGAPGYPDLPIQTRISLVDQAREARPSQAAAESEVPVEITEDPDPQRAELVRQLRSTMEQHPDEPEGLRLLAREEARLGNYRAAHNAQARLVEILGDEAPAQAKLDLAEMMFMAAGGYVSPEAEALFREVLEEDPTNGAARYYVGLMYAQQGRPDLGYPIWRDLLADSAPGDPWLPPIRAQIELVAGMAGVEVSLAQLPQPPMPGGAAGGLRGPSAADMDAAGQMSAEDRQAMIENMVAGLADRLATDGGSPAEWARLIGAYQVLGRIEDAQAVYDEALTVYADNEAALSAIRQAGADLEQPE